MSLGVRAGRCCSECGGWREWWLALCDGWCCRWPWLSHPHPSSLWGIHEWPNRALCLCNPLNLQQTLCSPSRRRLKARSVRTGEEAWSVELQPISGPTAAGGSVAVVTPDGLQVGCKTGRAGSSAPACQHLVSSWPAAKRPGTQLCPCLASFLHRLLTHLRSPTSLFIPGA